MGSFKTLISAFSIPSLHPLEFGVARETIGLMSKNVLSLLLIAGFIVTIWNSLPASFARKSLLRLGLTIFLFIPWIVRLFSVGYAYDTSFALLCQLSDILVFSYSCYLLGESLGVVSTTVAKVSVGISVITLAGVGFTFVGLHALLPQPSFITNLIFVGVIVYLALKRVPWSSFGAIGKETYSLIVFVALLFLYCFHHYLLAPLPPDADITSIGEMLGYLFQGQNLRNVATGFGEQYVLRYPAGFPSLAFVMSHLLNIRASEAMVLFSYLAFFVLIFTLIALGKRLSLHPFFVALFSLNGAITGWFGLRGGQVHEMLCYALAITQVTLLLDNQWLPAALCLGASIVLSPVIALPFCLVFATLLIRNYSREHLADILKAAIVLLFCVAYIAFLGLGPSTTPSQPGILLSELTANIFVSNVVKYFKEDTFGYGIFLLAIPVYSLFFSKKSGGSSLLFLYAWFLGAVTIDGLFGHTHWTARFQKSFNLVGIWILSVCLSLRLWDLLWESALTRFRSWDRRILSVARMAGVLGLLIFWFVVDGPDSIILPSPVFTTHDNIRMGRFIAQNLPENALIYFHRLTVQADWDNLNMVRGDSARNSVQGRIFDHHVKIGEIKSRERVNACLKSDAATIANCFKGFGVNYLLLDAGDDSPERRDQIKKLPFTLVHQEATSYLFRFDP